MKTLVIFDRKDVEQEKCFAAELTFVPSTQKFLPNQYGVREYLIGRCSFCLLVVQTKHKPKTGRRSEAVKSLCKIFLWRLQIIKTNALVHVLQLRVMKPQMFATAGRVHTSRFPPNFPIVVCLEQSGNKLDIWQVFGVTITC